MTQLSAAQAGIITDEMRMVAEDEGIPVEQLRDDIARGWTIIPKNIHHDFRPRGIGRGLRTKVNANIGTSGHHEDFSEELKKLEVAVDCGTDSVMDLSTGHHLDDVRMAIISRSPVMVGTVPIYQVTAEGHPLGWTADDLFAAIEKQALQGVDYMTVHCGVTRESLKRIERVERIEGIVSRGGSLHAAWIKKHDAENPLYEQFDRLLKIACRHDVTLSLGDGLRPGATHDATDRAQVIETILLGELQQRALAAGVQVMIEGPGHVPIDQVAYNVHLEKKLCNGAPFYVLGPLSTDVAPGYDHITATVGGAIAAGAGVDMLCYVTPAEHLRLPTIDDVREGVIAVRIAAHSGDLVKGVRGAKEWDDLMSRYRKALDWEGMYRVALDPVKARAMREASEDYEKEVCTMCGTLCSIAWDNAWTRRGSDGGVLKERTGSTQFS